MPLIKRNELETESYRELFDRVPVGLFRTTREGEIIEANSTLVQMLGYHDRESLLHVNAIDLYVDPKDRQELLRLLYQDGLARNLELLVRRNDGSSIWVEMNVRAVLDENQELRFLDGEFRDITRRKELEERTLRSAQEMEAMLDVSSQLRQAVSSHQMVLILTERIIELMHAASVTLYLLANDCLIAAGARGIGEKTRGKRYHLAENAALWQVISAGEHIELVEENITSKIAACTLYQDLTTGMDYGVLVPLKTSDDVIGLMHVGYVDHRDILSEDLRQLLFAVVEIGGNALNRAVLMETLEERVRERTRYLSALYAVSAASSEPLKLPVILERMLEKVLEVMETDMAAIHLLKGDMDGLELIVHQGIPPEVLYQLREVHLNTTELEWIVDNPKPLVVMDMQQDRRIPKEFYFGGCYTYAGIPIRVTGKVLGVMSVFGDSDHTISAEDLNLMVSIGDQIGVVIENARLHQLDEEAAVLEERQRLARELHDSVTQSLYSITLMARAAQKLANNEKWSRANHYLDELGSTALQALKEMRLLIYELRPSALEEENLWGALNQRLQIVEKRAGIDVQLKGEPAFELPRRLEEGLYRIAIEALNNILKHAHASAVSITLTPGDEQISLEITDNGIGFDTSILKQNAGVGIRSMQERVEKLEGTLVLNSKPGKGTTIRVTVPLVQHEMEFKL